MAETFDAGHRETQKNLPGPLESGWYPGTWALPATTISVASLLVLLVVFGLLQIGGVSRALFQLPVASSWVALAAAAVAWGITWLCRKRPGGSLPRLWALGLSALATGVTAAAFLRDDLAQHPQVHGLALACLVASATLLPRLLKLHPAHSLVQHIAPLALLAALFVAVPASIVFGRHAVEDRMQRLDDTIAELTREAAEVRAVSAFEWSTNLEKRQETLQQMRRLQELPLEQWVPDRHLWRGAVLLGKDRELATAYRTLLDALVGGIDPGRTPKLWQTQFVWNREGRQWERDPVFPGLSAAVAGYHWRQGRMLQLLAPPPGEGEALRMLAVDYEDKKREAEERLAVLSETWAEDWVPPLFAAGEIGTAPAVSPMAELLERPLLADGSIRPASLEKLLDLTLWDAFKVADAAQGCGPRNYAEDDFDFFRIDCFAYAPRLDPEPGADLRVELRVVFKADEEYGSLSPRDLPIEAFFLFPVPPGEQAAPYREDVMAALQSAVGNRHPGATLDAIDRSGPAKGFSFETQAGRRLRVVSHAIADLSGGVAGIQVRAYYLDRTY
jgi:hypothetical protein